MEFKIKWNLEPLGYAYVSKAYLSCNFFLKLWIYLRN